MTPPVRWRWAGLASAPHRPAACGKIGGGERTAAARHTPGGPGGNRGQGWYAGWSTQRVETRRWHGQTAHTPTGQCGTPPQPQPGEGADAGEVRWGGVTPPCAHSGGPRRAKRAAHTTTGTPSTHHRPPLSTRMERAARGENSACLWRNKRDRKRGGARVAVVPNAFQTTNPPPCRIFSAAAASPRCRPISGGILREMPSGGWNAPPRDVESPPTRVPPAGVAGATHSRASSGRGHARARAQRRGWLRPTGDVGPQRETATPAAWRVVAPRDKKGVLAWHGGRSPQWWWCQV